MSSSYREEVWEHSGTWLSDATARSHGDLDCHSGFTDLLTQYIFHYQTSLIFMTLPHSCLLSSSHLLLWLHCFLYCSHLLGYFTTFGILKTEGLAVSGWNPIQKEHPCRTDCWDRPPQVFRTPVVCHSHLWLPHWLWFSQLWQSLGFWVPSVVTLVWGCVGNTWQFQPFLCNWMDRYQYQTV